MLAAARPHAAWLALVRPAGPRAASLALAGAAGQHAVSLALLLRAAGTLALPFRSSSRPLPPQCANNLASPLPHSC